MTNTKLKEQILELLKTDDRVWTVGAGDKKELNQTKLLNLVEEIDGDIIQLLLEDDNVRDKFFVKIKDVYIFKTNDFVFFMEENKVNNMYTQYKNKIGLTVGKRFLDDSKDVVLNWPFKDCILDGGQNDEESLDSYFQWKETTMKDKLDDEGNKIKEGRKNVKEVDVEGHYEKKQAKRDEVFFNEIIAADEIDRFEEPKALAKWCRYTADNKQVVVKDIDFNNENYYFKGNNLSALHSIKKLFYESIDLIYIDPPYNTGGSNQIFSYNNTFNHSTWLTFMKNRLLLAKDLLKSDGVLEIAIDKHEQEYLGVLIDMIFKGYEKHCVTIVHNPRGVQGSNFSYTHEYVYFVFKKGCNPINQIKRETPLEEEFKDHGGESLRTDAKNCFYPILVKNNKIIGFGKVPDDSFHPNKKVTINNGIQEFWPIDAKGIERKWVFAIQTVSKIQDKLFVKTKANKEQDIFRIKDMKKPRTVWTGKRYDASTFGSKIVNKIIDGKSVSFPKSIHAVYDCLYTVISNKKNARVLDFFSGSGTTAHALLQLNKEDNGNRKFILIEQLDEHVDVATTRISNLLEENNSFIYCELAKWNETAKEKINSCTSLDKLIEFFDSLYDKYFLNYNLKVKEFKEKIILEDNFRNLSLEEQKSMFLTMLDLNQMYVNESEMEDTKYDLSQGDIALTKRFYNKED